MRVLCVNITDGSNTCGGLTVGKWYAKKPGTNHFGNCYNVTDDFGYVGEYHQKWFITEKDHRTKLLNKLLHES
jgi:hypothetical protein